MKAWNEKVEFARNLGFEAVAGGGFGRCKFLCGDCAELFACGCCVS